jgi:hypothetical protein
VKELAVDRQFKTCHRSMIRAISAMGGGAGEVGEEEDKASVVVG